MIDLPFQSASSTCTISSVDQHIHGTRHLEAHRPDPVLRDRTRMAAWSGAAVPIVSLWALRRQLRGNHRRASFAATSISNLSRSFHGPSALRVRTGSSMTAGFVKIWHDRGRRVDLAVLVALADAGLPVPRPLRLDLQRTDDGRQSAVFPYVHGRHAASFVARWATSPLGFLEKQTVPESRRGVRPSRPIDTTLRLFL